MGWGFALIMTMALQLGEQVFLWVGVAREQVTLISLLVVRYLNLKD